MVKSPMTEPTAPFCRNVFPFVICAAKHPISSCVEFEKSRRIA